MMQQDELQKAAKDTVYAELDKYQLSTIKEIKNAFHNCDSDIFHTLVADQLDKNLLIKEFGRVKGEPRISQKADYNIIELVALVGRFGKTCNCNQK